MKLFNKHLTTAAFTLSLLAAPVMAAPVSQTSAVSTAGLAAISAGESNVIQIATRSERRAERRAQRRAKSRRIERRSNRRSERRARRSRHNGYRGYHQRRRGYRRHSNGFWYPLAAFGALAAIANSGHSHSSRHVRWCDNRYRSYRISDDTFQPYNGPRRRCNSPYN